MQLLLYFYSDGDQDMFVTGNTDFSDDDSKVIYFIENASVMTSPTTAIPTTSSPTSVPTSSPTTTSPAEPEFVYMGVDMYGTDTFKGTTQVSIVDFDSDGDFDIFVGKNNGKIYYYENIAQEGATVPSFATKIESPFGLIDVGKRSSPALVDIDDDGDYDMFVCNHVGDLVYFENTDDVFTMVTANGAFGGLYGTTYCSPTFVDIDNDDDYDCILGTEDGDMLYYENLGNATNPSFTVSPITNAFNMIPKNRMSVPTFHDIDNDGDLDFFKGDKNGKIYYQENIGDASNPIFENTLHEAPFGLDTDIGYLSAPAFFGNDKDADLWVGDREGALHLFERIN